MIVISKHTDTGESLFSRGLTSGAEDVILIRKTLTSDFPMFNLETDDSGFAASKKDSEFSISFSFLQDDISAFDNDTILNFLRKGNRNYRYHIVIEAKGFVFTGTFKSNDINYGFTFSDDSYKAGLMVKGVLAEFYEYTKDLTSDFEISAQAELSFETIIESHVLDFIDVNFNGMTYNNRLNDDIVFQQIYYGNTGAPSYTDWSKVSRWEFFFSLVKGMGFDFDFELKYTTEEIYNSWYANPLSDLYQIKIFFKTDITDSENYYTINSAETHNEFTIPKGNRYVFIKSRQQVPDPLGLITVIRGTMTDGNVYYESDSNDTTSGSNFAQLPYFQLYKRDGDDYGLVWRPAPSVEINIPYTAMTQIDVNHYSNPVIQAYGQYIRAGVISPAHFFVSKNGSWHLPVARYAINQYKRYINSEAKKGKELTVDLNDVLGIKLYSKVVLTDMDGTSDYYVSRITDLDIKDEKVKLTVIQL